MTYEQKPFTVGDIERLRQDAPRTTHLDRYDLAHQRAVARVLDVRCPYCEAPEQAPCFLTS